MYFFHWEHLRTSGSVQELSDHNLRVLISQTRLDLCSGPLDAAGSTGEKSALTWVVWWQPGEPLWVWTTRLGMIVTSLGVLMTHLGMLVRGRGAPQLTEEQSGKHNIMFWNTAVAPRNHRYYLLFNEFQTSCIWFVFSSIQLWVYTATQLHPVYLDWLQTVLERKWRCAWTRHSSELRDTLGGHYAVNIEMLFEGCDQASLQMHLEAGHDPVNSEAIIKRDSGYSWRPHLSDCKDSLGGHDRARLEEYLESGGTPGAWDSVFQIVDSYRWKYEEVTVPVSSHWELAGGSRSCRKACQKLNLNSRVNS